MKKRTKYRPRPLLLNPIGYVLGGFEPMRAHKSQLLDLKLKNHDALTNLTRGVATRDDIDVLVEMFNTTRALWILGFGAEYADELKAGFDSLSAVKNRGAESGKFILKSEEMNAINLIAELHDAQMEVITIGDLEKALKIVRGELASNRAKTIKEKKA